MLWQVGSVLMIVCIAPWVGREYVRKLSTLEDLVCCWEARNHNRLLGQVAFRRNPSLLGVPARELLPRVVFGFHVPEEKLATLQDAMGRHGGPCALQSPLES